MSACRLGIHSFETCSQSSNRSCRPLFIGFRTRLKLRNRLVAVVVCRYFRSYKDVGRWLMKCVPGENRLVTVLARLSPTNDGFMDYFVVPPIGTSKSVRLLKNDPRLSRAVRLDDLRDFMAAVATVSTRKQPSIIWEINEKSVAIATNDQLRRLGAFPRMNSYVEG
jgi:hypothetical protein